MIESISIERAARVLAGLSLVLATACHKSNGGSVVPPPNHDTTPPVVTIRFPISGTMTDAATIHVSGTAVDPSGVAAVHVNGAVATTSDGFATWTAVVQLHKGTNVLQTSASDVVGNGDPAAASVTIEDPGTFLLDVLDVAADLQNNRLFVSDTLVDAILSVDLADGTRDVVTGKGVGQGPDLSSSQRLAVDLPHGRLLALDSQDLRLLSVDLAAGDRTELSGPAAGKGPLFSSPRGLALDAARGRALVANDLPAPSNLLAVDLAGGVRTVFSGRGAGEGPAFVDVADVAMDAVHNRVLVVDAGALSLLAADATTGDRTILSSPTIGTGPSFSTPRKLAVDVASNTAYVEDPGLAAILSVDLATGKRTIVSDSSRGTGPALRGFAGIALDPAAGMAYHAAPDEVTSVDLVTGDRSPFSSNARGGGTAFEFPDEIALDQPAGRLFVKDVRNGGSAQNLVAVDLATGARTVISSAAINSTYFHTDGFALDPARISIWGAAPAMGLTRQVLAVYNLSTSRIRVGETLSAPPQRTIDMEIDPSGRLFTLESLEIRMRHIGGGPRLAPISDGYHGTGPMFSTNTQREVYDADRDRLLVTDGGKPVALFAVDATTGDRSILSGAGIGGGPVFVAPGGVAVGSGRVLVLDTGALAMFGVDPVTGDRSVVTAGGAEADVLRVGGQGGADPVGTGPLFQNPRDLAVDPARNIAYTANELRMNGILIVDLVSGDRLLLSR